jgi:hypothetical protein
MKITIWMIQQQAGFQNDWALSNNDAKLMKKQQDNLKALDNFFAKMDEDIANESNF